MNAAAAPRTAPELLRRAVERDRDAIAVVTAEDDEITYGELATAAGSFAAALVERGIRAGDRVGIWSPNGLRWIVAAFGIWNAGATLVPVNTRFKGGEAADVLSRSGARALVTTTDFLGNDHTAMLRDAGVDCPALELVVVAQGQTGTGDDRWTQVGWDELASGFGDRALAEAGDRAAAVSAEDASDIMFTSGTTGRPKGVVQTHGRTLRVAADWVDMTGLRSDDRYLMVNPYFHMFGLKAGILASVTAGAAMYPEPVFDVDRVLRRVQDRHITVLPGPPTLYQGLLDGAAGGDVDLSSLRLAVTGAADIPVELIHRVREELPFEVVVTGYGLTEAGTIAATSPEDDPETVATTVGRPRPGFEIRLVDDQGADVAVGDVGEVVTRGPSVMREYLDDPAATAEVLDPDGWLRTGDLATVDDRGNLRIVGRSKDMFIVGGFNVYPAEVENLLLAHPDVAQVAVVGMPDGRLGEVGAAFVVSAPDSTIDPGALVAWARENMANYKAPRQVLVVESLPVNATGKVVKDDLRALVGEL